MAIYEFLIRGDITGNIVGAHALVFDANGNVTPAGLTQLTPEELAQIPAWAISTAQVVELQQQIDQLQAMIEAQRQQLSKLTINDWDGLIDALKVAGFSQWLANAGNSQPDLLDEVARLYAAAKVGDRLGVITEYLTISAQYEPSIEQLQGWQAVLDNYQPHPIPANLLWFVQPGASTGP